MSIRKYTVGKILRDKDEEAERKEASKNFTAADREELEEELAEDAPEDSE